MNCQSDRTSVMEQNDHGDEIHLWLLHHDDSRFLYLSFLLSAIAHVLLFLVLVTTKLFQPQIGSSLNFHMVWLAADGVTAKPAPHRAARLEKHTVATRNEPVVVKASPTPARPEQKPVPAIEQFRPDTEGQIAVARFGGKVVEIIDRNDPGPGFTIFSSVMQKSPGTTAVVRSIRETTAQAPKKPERTATPTPSPAPTAPVSPSRPSPPVIPERAPNGEIQNGSPNNHVAPTPVSIAKPSLPMATAPVSLQIPAPQGTPTAPTPARTSSAVSTGTGSPVPRKTTAVRSTDNGRNPVAADTAPTPATPTVITKQESPPPSLAPQSHMPFQPPLLGDLKLVITTEGEITVEGSFREFRKSRRHKPLTRWESDNKRRLVVFAMARIGRDTREAVIGKAEEGIYDILVSSADGKPLRGQFTLKINENGTGGRAIPLGIQTINGAKIIARVLMPEGILWENETSFTGSMEDSDSVTKFDANSGLIWREYR